MKLSYATKITATDQIINKKNNRLIHTTIKCDLIKRRGRGIKKEKEEEEEIQSYRQNKTKRNEK